MSETGGHPKLEIYSIRTWLLAQRWRWRVTAANNEIIGASSEGYWSKRNCLNNLVLLQQALYMLHQRGDLIFASKKIDKEEAAGKVDE